MQKKRRIGENVVFKGGFGGPNQKQNEKKRKKKKNYTTPRKKRKKKPLREKGKRSGGVRVVMKKHIRKGLPNRNPLKR